MIFIYKALPPLPQTPASNGNLMVSPPRIRSSVHLGKITLSIKTSDFRNMRHIEQWVDLDNPYSKGAKVRIGLDFLWKKTRLLKYGQVIEDFYQIVDVLGEGVSGVVKSAKDKLKGTEVAIKFIPKTVSSSEEKLLIDNEIEVMQNLSHPNIVELYESFEGSDLFYLVMELVDGCELFDLIIEFGSITIEETGGVLRQVLSGVEYMHEYDIAHRDLKPENLLINYHKNIVKITDFGSAKIFNENLMMNTLAGSPTYIAPEILLGKPYDQAVDLWSIGVIAYIMICGFPPFDDRLTTEEMFREIIRGKYHFPSPEWDDVPNYCKDFVKRTLVVNPQFRATASELLESHKAWLTSTQVSEKPKDIINPQYTQRLQEHQSLRKASLKNQLSSRSKI